MQMALSCQQFNPMGYFMFRHYRIIFSGLLLSLLFSNSLRAQENFVPPEQLRVRTPIYQPDFSQFEPRLGTYTYEVTWQGIPAAEASVTINQDGLRYVMTTFAKTNSAIDIFYRLRYRAQGLISAITFLPEKTQVENRENSRIKIVEMNFRNDGTIHSVFNRNDNREVFDFDPQNLMLDPFSAAFIARSQEWRAGETKTFDTFNGKSRYLISLTALGREKITFDKRRQDVWVISPQVRKVTDPNGPQKLQSAKIYVTADKSRDVLQIVSSVFVGSVKTTLVKFEPAPSLPPVQILAQLRASYIK
jgi:hypothetical protein